MSLLDQLKKIKLRQSNTKVLYPDGKEIIETRDSRGIFHTLDVTLKPWGFVGDFKPDLQAAEIVPGLFLSSQDVAQESSLLTKLGITHILNVATNVDNHFVNSFTYKRIEILDLPTSDIRHHFDECFEFIDDALNKSSKVLVHCNAGISRSATIVVAYLMKTERLPLPVAMDKVRAVRSSARPNEGFMRQLHEFGTELQLNQPQKSSL